MKRNANHPFNGRNSAVKTTTMALSLLGAPPATAAALSFSKSRSQLSLPASAASVSSDLSSPTPALIYCGRGDKKTARGKRFKHSFGNARPRDKSKGRGPPRVPAPPLPPRKDKYDDGEVVRIEIDESFLS